MPYITRNSQLRLCQPAHSYTYAISLKTSVKGEDIQHIYDYTHVCNVAPFTDKSTVLRINDARTGNGPPFQRTPIS